MSSWQFPLFFSPDVVVQANTPNLLLYDFDGCTLLSRHSDTKHFTNEPISAPMVGQVVAPLWLLVGGETSNIILDVETYDQAGAVSATMEILHMALVWRMYLENDIMAVGRSSVHSMPKCCSCTLKLLVQPRRLLTRSAVHPNFPPRKNRKSACPHTKSSQGASRSLSPAQCMSLRESIFAPHPLSPIILMHHHPSSSGKARPQAPSSNIHP